MSQSLKTTGLEIYYFDIWLFPLTKRQKTNWLLSLEY